MTTNKVHDPLSGISLVESVIPSYTVSSAVGVTTGAYITAGTGANITWNSPASWTTTDVYTISPGMPGSNSGKLSLQGENADIDVNGVSLMATLKRIEERINLLTVNKELEADWDDLRELGEQYRALEQRIKNKIETWNKLKAQDKDNR